MRIVWGSVIVDVVIIMAAVYSRNWWLLCLLVLTGPYSRTREDD
jgi:hypothetical protein